MESNQLDFLRPFTITYHVPGAGWHCHYRQDSTDILIAIELVLDHLKRPLKIKHESTGEIIDLSDLTPEQAIMDLHLFYNRISDRGSEIV